MHGGRVDNKDSNLTQSKYQILPVPAKKAKSSRTLSSPSGLRGDFVNSPYGNDHPALDTVMMG